MPIDPNASLKITALKWVPDFAQGFVRDLRPRWACEEIGLDYAERLIGLDRPEGYKSEQPWSQVPVIDDGGIHLFESGAILLHIGEKDERLLRRDPQGRATTLSWLFAAFNTIEPFFFELGNVEIFAKGEKWAELRRPGLLEFMGQRLDALSDALKGRDYLAGEFSIADIAMATVLREAGETDLVSSRSVLADYLSGCLERPAFKAAMAAQLDAFQRSEPIPA